MPSSSAAERRSLRTPKGRVASTARQLLLAMSDHMRDEKNGPATDAPSRPRSVDEGTLAEGRPAQLTTKKAVVLVLTVTLAMMLNVSRLLNRESVSD